MNLNPIDFNYQDGLNRFPIQDYIDDAIKNDIVTSNIYMNDGSSLNEVLNFSNVTNVKHLYIKNKNVGGEIRFSTYTNYPDNGSNYGTKIDSTGKLYVYHNYNLLQPLFLSGWYDVESEILQLKADGISTDLQLTLLEANVVQVQQQLVLVDEIVANHSIQIMEIYSQIAQGTSFANLRQIRNSTTFSSAQDAVLTSYDSFRVISTNAYQNSITFGLTYGIIFGLAGATLGFIQTRQQEDLINGLINSNTNLTPTQRSLIKNDTVVVASNLSNVSNFNVSISNLTLAQGYINSNIVTPQLIPNINTNTITYNGVEISTTLNNYLLKAGGTMTGRINFNYGANVGVPVAGSGGSGERINLNINGITINDYAASIGVSANSLWFSAPNNQNYQWYVNGIERMSLTSNGVLNATTLQQGGVNITTISSNITLTQTPNLTKRYLIEFTCSTSILMPTGQTLFKRDIDLRLYTQTQTIPNPSSPFRIFSIKVWIKSGYFELSSVNNFNVLQYTVYQSLQSQSAPPGSAGENLYAVGTPPNPALNSITGGSICLVRTANFNFLSVLSVANGTVVNCVISDELF